MAIHAPERIGKRGKVTTDDAQTLDRLEALQAELELSDARMAAALGMTRQAYSAWKRRIPGWKKNQFPAFKVLGIRLMLELMKVDPGNETLPEAFRINPAA